MSLTKVGKSLPKSVDKKRILVIIAEYVDKSAEENGGTAHYPQSYPQCPQPWGQTYPLLVYRMQKNGANHDGIC